MLFDLRSRARRRTVQVVYVVLALIFLVGFLGFGVGGGFGGGGILENVFGGKEGTRASSYQSQISAAESQIRKNPNDPEGWAKLADARLHEANGSEYFNESTQQYTAAGKALLLKVASDWNHYMSFSPPKPNMTVAQEMLRVYGPEGLNQPEQNVQLLQQVVIPGNPPSAAWYGRLALFAYQSKNTSLGDLASKETLDLTPASKRSLVKSELEKIKENPTGNPSNEVYTSTVNGKKYNFTSKNGKNYVGKPAPATASKKK